MQHEKEQQAAQKEQQAAQKEQQVAQKEQQAAQNEQQVTRMTDIVSYQLERAVSGSSKLFRNSTPIRPVVEKLVAAIRKVYKEKNIEFLEEVSSADFPGDERDLMELLGNLLDNYCKYGHRKVRLVAVVVRGGVELEV